MEFKFEDYIGKYVMHCKTEKEAKDFCKVMDEDGRKWSTGVSYIDNPKYENYETETCYALDNWVYADSGFFKTQGYTILEWEDFMEFTKDGLKIGYVVQLRNGNYEIVMNSLNGVVFMDMGRYTCLDSYTEDLKYGGPLGKYDVIKVWGFANDVVQSLFIGTNSRDLLWERKEPKELTMQEIADKFGVDVKDLKIKK